MSDKTGIGWTDSTWSPLRAIVKPDAGRIATDKGYASLVQIATKMQGHVGQFCEHVSAGCKLCYSGTWQARCLPANGTGLPFDRRSRDLIDAIVDEKALVLPLKWRRIRVHEERCAKTGLGKQAACTCRNKYLFRPRRIFVENQSDLFGEWHTFEQIRRVFQVICEGRGLHVYQILTKRPERMLAFLEWLRTVEPGWFTANGTLDLWEVWLGVSVEDQATANVRIPLLLRTPAAKRFVSYEPALGPVDFRRWLRGSCPQCHGFDDYCADVATCETCGGLNPIGLDWLIVGGESGPGARPFDIQWARNAVKQCREAGVECFVKQLGGKPFDSNLVDILGPEGKVHYRRPVGHSLIDEVTPTNGYSTRPSVLTLRDRAGADPAEWPEGFVQEFPGDGMVAE